MGLVGGLLAVWVASYLGLRVLFLPGSGCWRGCLAALAVVSEVCGVWAGYGACREPPPMDFLSKLPSHISKAMAGLPRSLKPITFMADLVKGAGDILIWQG